MRPRGGGAAPAKSSGSYSTGRPEHCRCWQSWRQKVCLAGSNDLVDGQNWQATVARLLDPHRYWYVAQALLVHALRIARPFAVVLSLCFLLLGVAKNRARGTAGLPTAGAVLPLMLAGYFLVYVTTPFDLHWHLTTSAGRLLLHLWPLCIMVLFLCLATPEESLAEDGGGQSRELTAPRNARKSPRLRSGSC